MATRTVLLSEYGRLIDAKYLGMLDPANAERLAQIEDELNRREAHQARILRQGMDSDFADLDQKIAELEAKIAENASDPPKSRSATS